MKTIILLCFLFTIILSSNLSSPSSAFAGFWQELPNTNLRQVCPENQSEYQFYNKCQNVINAWSGAAYDSLRNRMIIWGGGHGDYYGNEIYNLDLNSFEIRRLTDPSSGFVIGGKCLSNLPDGSPTSRHTYGGLTYIAHADRLFAFGGSIACGSGGFGTDTWTFDFKTSTWHNMKPKGDLPGPLISEAEYDVLTKKVYLRNSDSFYAYDYNSNSWERLRSSDIIPDFGYMSATIDPVRRKFVIIGSLGEGNIYLIDISENSDYKAEVLQTSGGTIMAEHRSPGVAYDSIHKTIVAWDGSDNSPDPEIVYTLDLDTGIWRHVKASGGPLKNPNSRGTFGRWQYVPTLNAFVAIIDVDQNAFLYYPEDEDKIPSQNEEDVNTDPQPPPPSEVTDQINIPINTWVARKIPSNGDAPCSGGVCKHMRFAYNPIDKRFWELGGDHNGSESGFLQSGRMELYSYSVKDDEWRLEQPYCRDDGMPQPSGADEVGWVYDTNRNHFWLIPGFMHDQSTNCPGANLVRGKIMTYDPNNDLWSVPDIMQDPDVNLKWATYDSTNDVIHVYAHGALIYKYNIRVNSWQKFDYSKEHGNLQIGNVRPAFDAENRKVYFYLPSLTSLYEFDIRSEVLKIISTEGPSGPSENPDHDQWIHWDSNNKVILYPQWYDREGYGTVKMHAYHPETGKWEKDIPVKQPDESIAVGRISAYDPDQNVLLVMGAVWGKKSPYIFLYRYGIGSGENSSKLIPPDNLKLISK